MPLGFIFPDLAIMKHLLIKASIMAQELASEHEAGDSHLPSSRRSLLYASAGMVAGAAVSMLRPSTAVAHSQTAAGANSINVRDYGAVGNRIALDTTAFNNAIAAASDRAITIPSGTYIVGNITIPVNVTIVFEPGAILKPSGTPTITCNGTIDAGFKKIFDMGFAFNETTGISRLSAKAEWFGVRSAASFLDSGPQMQYAVNFCQSTRTNTLIFGAGYFYTNQTIVITKSVGIIGQGKGDTFIFGGGSIVGGEPIFFYNATSSNRVSGICFGNMTLRDSYDRRIVGIRGIWLTSSKIENVEFQNLHVGYDGYDLCWSMWIENITCAGNRYGVRLSNGCNDSHLYKSVISGTLTGLLVTGILNHLVVDRFDSAVVKCWAH